MTDTKRLRELHAQYWHSGLVAEEGDKFRSLILAACDELERLRDACVSTGWLDSETPLSMSNHVVQMYGEACVAQDNAATLRDENRKLRAALSSCRRLVKDKRFSESEKLKNIGRVANEHAPASPLRTIPTKDPDHD